MISSEESKVGRSKLIKRERERCVIEREREREEFGRVMPNVFDSWLR